MIAVDTNILVHAHRRDSDWHAPAFRRMGERAASSLAWAIPWPCVHEFLGIVTHPRIFKTPTSMAAALDQVDAWMESPTLALLGEPGTHWSTLGKLLQSSKARGPQVHDARIAALCLQHGVRELWSADRDFLAFRELKVVNPLIEG